MKKKVILPLVFFLIIGLVIANLNHIYIMIYKPIQFPYPPHEAIRDGHLVVYQGEHYQGKLLDNLEALASFIVNVQNGEKSSLHIVEYHENINLFSNHFFTTPRYRHILDYQHRVIDYRILDIDVLSGKFTPGSPYVDLVIEEDHEQYKFLLITDNNEESEFITIIK